MKKDHSTLNKENFASRLWRSALRIVLLAGALLAVYAIVIALMALRASSK